MHKPNKVYTQGKCAGHRNNRILYNTWLHFGLHVCTPTHSEHTTHTQN